jgi:hypothetical protein
MSAPFDDLGSLDPDQVGAFARAFITARYLLDHRGAALSQGLLEPRALTAGETLVQQLNHSERKIRLAALTAQVAVLARALQHRALREGALS